jgi:hypothetical protein
VHPTAIGFGKIGEIGSPGYPLANPQRRALPFFGPGLGDKIIFPQHVLALTDHRQAAYIIRDKLNAHALALLRSCGVLNF